MEASATWAEEQVADTVNDNRQYLRHSQLHRPQVPLDLAGPVSSQQYGNWLFFEYLSQRFGVPVVRAAWQQAGMGRRDGRRHSLGALRAALREHGGLAEAYVRFATANTMPSRFYPEGASYGTPAPAERHVLSPTRATLSRTARIDHLAARTYRFVPSPALRRGWRLRVGVHGIRPARARVVVHRLDGTVAEFALTLRRGRGAMQVPFTSTRIRWVSVTMANTSTRIKCGLKPRSDLSCGGRALDDDAKFALTVTARPR